MFISEENFWYTDWFFCLLVLNLSPWFQFSSVLFPWCPDKLSARDQHIQKGFKMFWRMMIQNKYQDKINVTAFTVYNSLKKILSILYPNVKSFLLELQPCIWVSLSSRHNYHRIVGWADPGWAPGTRQICSNHSPLQLEQRRDNAMKDLWVKIRIYITDILTIMDKTELTQGN